ncbi:MAG TPA: serine/threonine-protein kinase, partial [Polyangiaceae bacterium]|nr:serine/threonine-protein kinase [Polyangiaceae bacterium]
MARGTLLLFPESGDTRPAEAVDAGGQAGSVAGSAGGAVAGGAVAGAAAAAVEGEPAPTGDVESSGVLLRGQRSRAPDGSLAPSTLGPRTQVAESLAPSTWGPHAARPDRAAHRLGRRRHCVACGQRFGPTSRYCPFDGQVLLVLGEEEPRAGTWLGRVLAGRYSLERWLGEGGVGEVYQALDLEEQRMVAVKLLREELCRDEGAVEAFLSTARTLALTQSPGIVRTGASGQQEGRPYFVMELVAGASLRELLGHGPVEAVRAARWMLALGRVLAAAHEQGIVHRDLEPENVLVDPETGRVTVLDFGLTRAVASQASSMGASTRGVPFGTPEYLSPQQAAGGRPDAQSDQYSLGVIFYELLTGHPPFTGGSFAAILAKHMYQRPAEPSQLRSDSSLLTYFEPLVLRSLAKRPEQRFANLQEWVSELETLVAAASAPPDGWGTGTLLSGTVSAGALSSAAV